MRWVFIWFEKKKIEFDSIQRKRMKKWNTELYTNTCSWKRNRWRCIFGLHYLVLACIYFSTTFFFLLLCSFNFYLNLRVPGCLAHIYILAYSKQTVRVLNKFACMYVCVYIYVHGCDNVFKAKRSTFMCCM